MDPIQKVAAAVISWADAAIVTATAMFFGLAAYLQTFLVENPPAFRLLIVAAKCVLSIAAGWLAFLVFRELKASDNWTYIAVAVAGWGGADFINAVKEGIYDRVRRASSQASDGASKN